MTRADLEINQEGLWSALVFEQQTTLMLAVEMLLRCHLSPEQILTKTAMALEGSHTIREVCEGRLLEPAAR
jgi:hypothetical protein